MKIMQRTNYFILITALLILHGATSAHTERVHQYLAKEGYKLLKLYMGNKDIPIMADYVGYKETGNFLGWASRGSDYVDGTICCGAFREDVKDIVYGYGEAYGIPFAHDGAEEWYASITHFWEADQGDQALTNLDWVPTLQIPNAYMKIMRFYNDMWVGINNRVDAITVQGEAVRLFQISGNEGANMHYSSLTDFFKTGLVYISSTVVLNTQTNENRVYSGNVYVNEALRKKIVFEILGHMCHLIADMSVPAHTHNNSHVPNTGTGDNYEQTLMNIAWNDESFNNSVVTYWDANRVWNTYGNIMNPYVSYDNPLHMIMYSMNQIADHFSSRTVPGDNVFNSSNTELQQYFPYGIPPTTIDEYSVATIGSLTTIRDATFPHAIRAIAGLLYWFASETSLLPKNITLSNGDLDIPGGSYFALHTGDLVNLYGNSIVSSGGTIVIDGNPSFTNPVAAYIKSGAVLKSICGTIQEGVNHCSQGYTTEIQNGSFYENISVNNKYAITLVGKGAYSTYINGSIDINSSDNFNLHSFRLQNGNISVTNSTGQNISSILTSQCTTPLVAYNSSGSFYVDSYNSTFNNDNAYYLVSSFSDIEGVDIKNHQMGVYLSGGQASITSTNFCNNTYDVYVTNNGCGFVNGGTLSGDPSIKTFGNVSCTAYSLCNLSKTAITTSDGGKIDPGYDEFAKLSSMYYSITKRVKDENKSQSVIDFTKYKPDYNNLISNAKNFVTNYYTSTYAKEALSLITIAYKLLHDFENMKSYLETLIMSKSSSSIIYFARRCLIDYYINSKDYHEAIAEANYIINENPKNDMTCEVLFLIGLLNENYLSKKEDAINYYSLIVNKYYDNVFASLAARRLRNLGIPFNEKLYKNSFISEDASSKYDLSNYPNPFNPTTNITFTLQQQTNVKLIVYDVLGREVVTLVNGNYKAGRYAFQFDGGSMVSGTYFYSLITPQGNLSKKMLLVK